MPWRKFPLIGCQYNISDISLTRTDFNLDNERSKLDEQGLQIGESQESSLRNRRKLAESTRGIVSFLFFRFCTSFTLVVISLM